MPPVQTSQVITGFVSQKVKQTALYPVCSCVNYPEVLTRQQVPLLYSQCVRCILAPLKPFGSDDSKALLENLFRRFSVDKEIHDKILLEEKNYSRSGALVQLLRTQLAELDEHPFYGESSFFSATDFQKWRKLEQKRIEGCLEKMSTTESSSGMLLPLGTALTRTRNFL